MVNKIFWSIGQEITPETFIQADNYICNQHNLIRRLIADKYYGLLPPGVTGDPSIMIKANLNRLDLYIDRLVCYGITEAGYLISFDNNALNVTSSRDESSSLGITSSLGASSRFASPPVHFTIPNSNAKAFYVVLRVNPFEQVLIEPVDNDEAPEAHSDYSIIIRELGQITTDELAIAKIDNSNYSPIIDNSYIPPCMSVNACSQLLKTFESFKTLFAEIRSIITYKKDQFGKLMYPLTLLQFELNEFSLSDPPIALVRLIKKIITTCQFFIPDVRKIVLPDAFNTYCHNDVAIVFKSLLSCLQEVKLMVGKVEVVEEEDFTPRI